jgi:hypothetical protein
MKSYNRWSLVFLMALIYTVIGNAFAEEWGDITNGVQISIEPQKDWAMRTNEPVLISLKIKNTLTNETFCFYFSGSPEASFSYEITSPSGKRPPHNDNIIMTSFSTGTTWVPSNTTNEYHVNLSNLYIFNEIGAYNIVVTAELESRTMVLSHGDRVFDESKAFRVVSNPLVFTLVPSK